MNTCLRCGKRHVFSALCDHCEWIVRIQRHTDALRAHRAPPPLDDDPLQNMLGQVLGF